MAVATVISRKTVICKNGMELFLIQNDQKASRIVNTQLYIPLLDHANSIPAFIAVSSFPKFDGQRLRFYNLIGFLNETQFGA